MRNVAKAGALALAAFLWFLTTERVLPLSWGFAGIAVLVLPTLAFAIVAAGYGLQAIADAFLKARESHSRGDS
jgi:hypothetical protein